jgi:hypothetical protein
VTPQDLRRSFCSLAGRRGVDPIEAAQITGHSPAVWARFYARSFGKAQRDEARDRLLKHGFGALSAVSRPVRSHHARTATLPKPVCRERSNRKWRNLLQKRRFRKMERTGIEPVTSGLQSRRSPS